MADDDADDEGFGGAYEGGHWVWDTSIESLVFVSDRPPEVVDTVTITAKAPTGTIEFKDDIDLIEQSAQRARERRPRQQVGARGGHGQQARPPPPPHHVVGHVQPELLQYPGIVHYPPQYLHKLRYRKRYQRKLKPHQANVITVQDVKDLALYTAPVFLLSPMLIDMLHHSTTERFIRALIFYCQYYLQVGDIMEGRMIELESKIRTPDSVAVEKNYKENLMDLRAVVAKEYCTMMIGGSDMKKFHHMGPQKKRRSLSDKDARLFETLLRMCIQIVWLALGRRCYNKLELEVNRLFKSDIFNSAEHTLKTDYINKMSKEERDVILGDSLGEGCKLNARSPVMKEVFSKRHIDYRMMGLGVIKYPQLSPRLLYIYLAIAGKEEDLLLLNVTCGILGYARTMFDTMLKPLPKVEIKSKSKQFGIGSAASMGRSSFKKSSIKSKSALGDSTIYPRIELPLKDSSAETEATYFCDEPEAIRRCSKTQCRKWQIRLQKLLQPAKARRS